MRWTDNELAEIVRRAMAEHRHERGERVRALRKARHWSQEDLATHAGVSVKTVSRIETGQVEDPRGPTVSRIATALGIAEGDIRGELPELPVTGAADQLDRIEAIVTELLELVRRVLENGV